MKSRFLTLGLFLVPLLLLGLVPASSLAAGSASNLTGSIRGPQSLGESLKGTYTLNASGGPAQAANGTFVGTISFKTTLEGINTTGALVSPPSGVLTNGSTKVVVTAPNLTVTLTVAVEFTSSYQGHNATLNTSMSISIISPYRLYATLVVGNSSVSAFGLSVTLDGAVVGTIAVPGLSAGDHYPIRFAYASSSLSAGWHTFSISLAQTHGLVRFADGTDVLAQSFYVAGPTPNNTLWYLSGVIAFIGAIFIWGTSVGARRRGRAKT